MATVTLKNVPPELLEALKRVAAQNRRSLNQEALLRLETSVRQPPVGKDKVKAIHDQVNGTLPDGSTYDANDPWLLAWVQIAGAINFLDGWRRYAEPSMSAASEPVALMTLA